MAANLRQAPANLKHFRGMLDFTPAQLKNVIASAIALKKVRVWSFALHFNFFPVKRESQRCVFLSSSLAMQHSQNRLAVASS